MISKRCLEFNCQNIYTKTDQPLNLVCELVLFVNLVDNKVVYVRYILMADKASLDASGKMNLLGVFNRFCVPSNTPEGNPIQHPECSLIAVLAVMVNETGTRRKIAFKLLNSEGRTVCALENDAVDIPKEHRGTEFDIPLVFDIKNLIFPGVGTYTWKVEVDGMTLDRDLTIDVTKAE
jgi:hypothetical protein